jgi:hypothetical protein
MSCHSTLAILEQHRAFIKPCAVLCRGWKYSAMVDGCTPQVQKGMLQKTALGTEQSALHMQQQLPDFGAT